MSRSFLYDLQWVIVGVVGTLILVGGWILAIKVSVPDRAVRATQEQRFFNKKCVPVVTDWYEVSCQSCVKGSLQTVVCRTHPAKPHCLTVD